ncbi:sulfatase-like hydrolase/transferase [Vagococcus sp. BWB3-3]|uniref:Sulfatase-like hydrolase/transferase n=1 Tax=Vagococcus allomyrinae TaxID=2794353 RepID=A0A940PCH5_9ENTE|nr:sulfatase-like hydrolase/transferase [Vagococcus allomyrinae]MBP1041463.1 sulfatase-like hydrolase/transferase [Vagococcus allomyrinae]
MTNKNVLFILTDDQRFDTIHALGNQEIQTPHLDELVASGISFEQAHIPGGTSGAVCMPSRAMIHSSQSLFKLKNCGETIPDNHPLLGETLKNAGYQTCGIGKWHNGTDSYARSFSNGNQIFFGGMWDHWNVPTYRYDKTGAYRDTHKFTQDPFSTNTVIEIPAEQIELGKHSTDLFADETIHFLKHSLNKKQPFFMYTSFLAPHDPRTMPEKYQQMYQRETLSLPDNFLPEHPFEFDVREQRDESLEKYPRQKQAIQQHLADYYAMISHLDDAIGKIIATLKAEKLYEETIIIFCGDNGIAIGQHGLMGKQNLYDHSIRVPLIMAGPGLPKGEKRQQYVYLMDIFPTICELVGLPVPDSLEGQSLMPVIQKQLPVRDGLFSAFTDKIRSYKNDRYKLIDYRTQSGNHTQLFDLQTDPFEMTDLSQQPAYDAILTDLQAALKSTAIAWGDLDFPQGKTYWSR